MLKIRGDPWNFICTIPKLSGTKVGGFLDFTTQYRNLCHITRNRKVDVCKCTWRIRMSVRMTAWAAFEVNSEAKIRNLWEARQVCMVTCSFEFESPRSLHGKNYFHFDSKTAILGWQRLTPCSLTRSGNIGKFDLVTRFPPFLENLVPNPNFCSEFPHVEFPDFFRVFASFQRFGIQNKQLFQPFQDFFPAYYRSSYTYYTHTKWFI